MVEIGCFRSTRDHLLGLKGGPVSNDAKEGRIWRRTQVVFWAATGCRCGRRLGSVRLAFVQYASRTRDCEPAFTRILHFGF